MKQRTLGEKLKTWLTQWWLLIIPVVLTLAAVGSYAYTFHAWPTHERPEAWGTFGDFVGGLLNPVIAACTLFVALGVWKLQKTELLETQAALKDQAKTAEQQRSEQRFFDVLNLYFRTLDEMVYHNRSGRSAIAQWVATHLRNKPIETLPLSFFFQYRRRA